MHFRYVSLSLLASILAVSIHAQTRSPNYEVGPEDLLQISVAGQKDFSGDFEVEPDGMVNYPLLGRVKAAGQTTAEIERKLTTLLSDGYLRRPQVAVWVKEFRSQKVYMTGEVQRPGPHGLKGDGTILTMLTDQSGQGPLQASAGHVVWVIRPPATRLQDVERFAGDPARNAPAVDVPGRNDVPGADVPGTELFRVVRREIEMGAMDKNLVLKAGDTLYAPKAAQVYLQGQVGRPGPIRFEDGLTVEKALALGGGVTNRGAAGRIKLMRMVGGKRQEIKPRLEDLLLAEDTLVVPERFF